MNDKYLIRLDDACHQMSQNKWHKIEQILDEFDIKPIVAVIPNNLDKKLIFDKEDNFFWNKVQKWQNKGWAIGMHGYQHELKFTNSKSLLPFYSRSEFTGVTLNDQVYKIQKSYEIFCKNNIKPLIWIAPAHTFDKNTLIALSNYTPIKIISDGLAINYYKFLNFIWLPVQLWKFRKMYFGTWTICLHPNLMEDRDIDKLYNDIKKNYKSFISISDINFKNREKNLIDKLFSTFYWLRRKIKH